MMIDLRSDLMGPRTKAVADAMSDAVLRTPTMEYGEDAYERALGDALTIELGVEAVLLVPTCTMANQIAIRLHLPDGGHLATAPYSHIVTAEAPSTAMTGVETFALQTDHNASPDGNPYAVPANNGHPTPESVRAFLVQRDAARASLVWLENTHMLSAGSLLPAGAQAQITALCHDADVRLHLDGSRLWNAAAASNASMSELVAGCDSTAISLNKAIGAPVGSILAGSRAMIEEAVRMRRALSGEWRPISSIAAAALASLAGWRTRLEADTAMTGALAAKIADALGEPAVQPAPTNLILLNRPSGDAARFVAALERKGVRSILVTPGIVRLAIHNGIRDREVAMVADAVVAADTELVTAA